MNRRTFLGSLGLVGSVGAFAANRSGSGAPLDVVVWFSERASAHDGLRPRVASYLGGALESAGADVALGFGERPIPLDREQGRRLMTVEWPRRVLSGALGVGAVDSIGDVNLLITDGDPTSRPAGYGMEGVGAITGARSLAAMAPAEDAPTPHPPTRPAIVTQLLLHECGHALGLSHGHGTVYESAGAVVATPMIGGYAWAPDEVRRRQVRGEHDRCGASYPITTDRPRRLSLRYGTCAGRTLRDRWGSDAGRQ